MKYTRQRQSHRNRGRDDDPLKTARSVVSLVLWLSLAVSSVFNLLFMLDVIGWGLARLGLAFFVVLLFFVSLAGLIVKHKRREEVVRLNIMTPAKEIGRAYTWTLILWVITNAVVLLFRWHIIRFYTDWW